MQAMARTAYGFSLLRPSPPACFVSRSVRRLFLRGHACARLKTQRY
ncbi:hypothetical protein HMPREF1548_05782 [Clostridium sp. KLE 1755]|nr:hypothetical protein HMPREF1548_05782 [Clostridium sp. KLE 1755]